MVITPTYTTGAAPGTQADRGSGLPVSPQAASTGLAQSDFLRILTAELQSQDPLNPMDSGTLVTQATQMQGAKSLQDLVALGQQANGLLAKMVPPTPPDGTPAAGGKSAA